MKSMAWARPLAFGCLVASDCWGVSAAVTEDRRPQSAISQPLRDHTVSLPALGELVNMKHLPDYQPAIDRVCSPSFVLSASVYITAVYLSK